MSNDRTHECPCDFLKEFEDKTEKRFEKIEKETQKRFEKIEGEAQKSNVEIQDIKVTLAKMNVKLSGILWGLAAIGSTLIGVIVKYIASL